MVSFRAVTVDRSTEDGTQRHRAEIRHLDETFLTAAPVAIDVEYSSLNYKDGLAIAGRPGVVRHWPLIPGIDIVGTVTSSDDPRWSAGDRVILTGDEIGERLHGGLAERARVSGDALVRLPATISAKQAAAIGTAGITAMMCTLALERHGVVPGELPVIVTGAAGGVGSVAVLILSRLGYSVIASTGRVDTESELLRRLGATTIIDRAELGQAGKPLQAERWAGAVDSVGSTTLANVLAQTAYGGTVAACGLAQGPDLPTTVFPFILRGVTLAGIDSDHATLDLRREAWSRLEAVLDLALLDELTTVIPLDAVFDRADRILAGAVRGRTVVDVRA